MTDRKQSAIDLAREFARVANQMGFDAEAFANEIRREHRTIQQNVGGAVLELLSQWADDNAVGNYDARNQDICSVAALMEKYNPGKLPYI